jgi:hypothetical protein
MAENNQWMNGNQNTDKGSNAIPSNSGVRFFEIRVKGQLNSRWSEWLEGLDVKLLKNGEMMLFGPIVDQAALMGVLNKISHLNLTLISVNEMNSINSEEAK